MPTLFRSTIIGLFLLSVMCRPAWTAPAAKPTAPPPKKTASQVTLDFKDIELTDLIQTVSELTGKNFVYDDTVKGKVTIVSPRGMSLSEAYQVFLTVLNVKGFTIIPSGKSNKIVRTQEAKENNLPTASDAVDRGGEEYVTRLVQLNHVEASVLATTVLTPLVPKSSSVVPYAPTNTLIITDSVGNIDRLLKIIAELDVPAGGKTNINVYYLENADAEPLAKTLNEIVAGPKQKQKSAGGATGDPLTITADKATNALVINASAEDYATIQEIIKKLDIKRKQVFVEALILELSMDATQKLGTSLAGVVPVGNDGAAFGAMNQVAPGIGVAAPNVTTGVPSILTQSVDGILAGGLFNMVNVTAPDGTTMRVPALSALINLSKTDTDVNIVSAPRLLTSDNEEAQIVVGSNVPIITSRLTNAVSSSTPTSTGLATSVSVERKDVALTLRFTPQVTEGDLVRLKVYQEITDISKNSVGTVDQVGPTFTKRLLQNTVVAQDGKTVVLGGLIGNSVQEVVTKVPLLGDIPFLGWLFKRKETVEKKTNLLIFITPKIIRSADDLLRVTDQSRDAMNQFQKAEMNDALKENSLATQALGLKEDSVKAPDSTPPAPEQAPHE